MDKNATSLNLWQLLQIPSSMRSLMPHLMQSRSRIKTQSGRVIIRNSVRAMGDFILEYMYHELVRDFYEILKQASSNLVETQGGILAIGERKQVEDSQDNHTSEAYKCQHLLGGLLVRGPGGHERVQREINLARTE